ncbi:MAG TPA: hypothetical protein VNM37_14650, partial [Candidatus Dormibacteraeota bacterium]|nr:hypothetical protein [Candidatus Dormibacteraeota bacterium]
MICPTHLRRLFIFAIAAGVGFAGLGFRLYVLQVLHHDRYRDIVGDNTQRVFLKPPRRGDILDVNGHELAMSLPVKRVLADPSLLDPYQPQVARAIGPLLSLDEAALIQSLRLLRTNETGVVRTNRFVDLKCQVNSERWGQITQAMAQLKLDIDEAALNRKERAALQQLRRHGIYAQDDYQRIYPSGRLASHVLGYVLETERLLTNSMGRAACVEMTGIAGTESWLDGKLRGMRGWRVTELDRFQREIVVFREQDVE